jgi:hypothetical protein
MNGVGNGSKECDNLKEPLSIKRNSSRGCHGLSIFLFIGIVNKVKGGGLLK